MMRARKIFRELTLAALLSVSALATGFTGVGMAQAETTVRAVLGSDLQSLDPIQTSSYATRTFGYLVYDTLFSQDSKGVIQPQMVDTFTVSPDGKVYTFVLRGGLAFSDGKPVTAADVVASLKRWEKQDGMGEELADATGSLVAKDDRTVVLTLAKPYGLVLDALAKQASNVPFIMPERLASTDPTVAVTEVVGSGPFLFKADEWVPGSKAVFVKNPAYKPRSEPADGLAGGKVVNVDRVEILTIPDGSTAVSALKNDELDYIQYVPFDLLPLLKGDDAVVLAHPEGPAATMGVVRLNHANPPFDNPKVRKAAQQAINRAEVLAAIGAGTDYGNADCVSIYTCGSPYASSAGTADIVKPEIAKAKAMLKEAGAEGAKIRILTVTSEDVERASSAVIVDQLRQAGFDVEVEPLEMNALFTRRKDKNPVDKGGWSAFVTNLSGYDLGSPVTSYYVVTACNPNYPGWSCDPRTKELVTAFYAEPDLEKRKAIAAEINARVTETVPFALWGEFTQPFGYSARLSGVLPTGDPVFWNVKKAD